MYDYIPFILGFIALVLGIIMTVSPKSCTKAEFRNSEKMVKKTKTNGIIEIICGVIIIVIGILRLNVL